MDLYITEMSLCGRSVYEEMANVDEDIQKYFRRANLAHFYML